MRMMLLLAIPVIASPFAGSVALAQTPPAAAPAAPSAAAVAAATAMVEVISPEVTDRANLQAQLENVRKGALIAQLIGANPRVQQVAKSNRVGLEAMLGRAGAIQATALTPLFNERRVALRAATINAFARQFSISELNAAAAFYRSPLGVKLLSSQPLIAQSVNQQVQAQFAPRIEAAQKTVAPRIEAELKSLFPDQPVPAAAAAPAKR